MTERLRKVSQKTRLAEVQQYAKKLLLQIVEQFLNNVFQRKTAKTLNILSTVHLYGHDSVMEITSKMD